MYIRAAASVDQESIRQLYLSAFPETERELVATLAVNLLMETTTPETVALVAVADGDDHVVDHMVGHIAFSPVFCGSADRFQGYILAPLAVHPRYQRQGVGTKLIDAGIQHLLTISADIVFVYGDPDYYGRFGFDAGLASGYAPPYQLQYAHGWQARVLTNFKPASVSEKLTCVAALREPQLW